MQIAKSSLSRAGSGWQTSDVLCTGSRITWDSFALCALQDDLFLAERKMPIAKIINYRKSCEYSK